MEELSKLGVQILRFNNREVIENIEGVFELILKTIKNKRIDPPHLNPLPSGERGNFENVIKGFKK